MPDFKPAHSSIPDMDRGGCFASIMIKQSQESSTALRKQDRERRSKLPGF